MTRKQALFLILINAVLSALISLCVVLMANRLPPVASFVKGSATAAPVQQGPAAGLETPIASQPGEPAAPPEGASASTATPVVYVVEPGDTISSLSFKFDVPGADIVAANQIQNPDILHSGVELVIPVGGFDQGAATWTPVPTMTGTPLPFAPPSEGSTATAPASDSATVVPLSTAEPASGGLQVGIEILGVGDLQSERVHITNTGGVLADLEGWTLSDAEGNTYIFPNYRLWPDGNVTVYTGAGQDGSPLSSLFWGRLEPVWSPGDAARLRDATGQVIATHGVE